MPAGPARAADARPQRRRACNDRGEVSRATSAIIAEARAASQAALADRNCRHPGAEPFLRVRLNRLAKAAAEAVASAQEDDAARLRHYLRRFEAVTSAIWTAEHALCGPAERWISSGVHEL